MILVIDNYDSFTYNLVQLIGELGADPEVHRNDALTVDAILARKPRGIIISPGPGRPEDGGVSLELIAAASGRVPLLGVCLGHQSIGQAMGGEVIRIEPLHGKSSEVHHDGSDLFRGLPNPFRAGRYHSLVVDARTFPSCLEITARTESGVVMGLRHREHATFGVQFHPESILTGEGSRLLANFLALTGEIAPASAESRSAQSTSAETRS